MGKFDSFLSVATPAGYFRRDAEDQFPWQSGTKGVWYALLAVEDGEIHTYGFTSSGKQRDELRKLLLALGDTSATLIGVWTGVYGTSLFILDKSIALTRL